MDSTDKKISDKKEKILISSPRSHKDGHLFEIHPSLIEWVEQYQHFKGVTKSILELINLISLRGMSSSDGLVSTTELIDATEGKLTRAAIQQRLRAAVNIGLFTQYPIRFEEGLAGRSMLNRFVNPNQLITILGVNALSTEQDKQQTKQKKSKALAQTHVNKRLLTEHGLGKPPSLLDEKDQFVVSPTSWAGIIDQALAPPRTKRSYLKAMVSISGSKAIVETRSSKSIMTIDDMMTLFVLFTLTVQYHDHHIEDYELRARNLTNKTPVYITDILALRGKKDSGPARDAIRDSIDRIEFTDFHFHELAGRWLSENMPEGFKSDRFRFIARTITGSEEAPQEDKRGQIRIKPNLYILVWEPAFFEELLTRDYFFLFPPEILRQHPWVFQLYSYFRSRMVRRSEADILLSELNQKIARGVDWKRFSTDLLRELKKLAKEKVSEGVIAVNLFGYHLIITPVNDGKLPDYRILIKVDVDEVIRFSRAKMTNAGKRTMAPTLPNPLRNEILPKHELDHLSDIIDGEFEPVKRKMPDPSGKLGRRVKQRKHLVEINADELVITLSKYTSEEAFQRSVTALSAMSGHSAATIAQECRELVEKLEWLKSGEDIISYEQLSKLVELYNTDNKHKHLSIERLISGLAVRKKVTKLIAQGHYNDLVMETLSDLAE